MSLNNIFWQECNEYVNDDIINEIEKNLNISFPKKFVQLIKFCDGGVPVKTDFQYMDNYRKEYIYTGIDNFLYLNSHPKYYEHILGLYHSPPAFFPKNLVAFADAGGGDFVCFDYRTDLQTDNPPIVYWNHEADVGKDVSFVAKDFEAFLSLLHAPDDDF